jgi:hypothetical protein
VRDDKVSLGCGAAFELTHFRRMPDQRPAEIQDLETAVRPHDGVKDLDLP